MKYVDKKFEITYQEKPVQVFSTYVMDSEVFLAKFSNPAIQPLHLTKMETADRGIIWTSLPEGRQKFAEVIGKLIDDYLNKFNSIQHVLF